MTKLEMVQQALAESGDVPAADLAAFIEQRFGVKIEPKFIPIYRATSLGQQVLEKSRQAAKSLIEQAGVKTTAEPPRAA